MSKMNAVRIINLNYNNNSIRISDETFQLGGQSTLLSLRNGGGKSVLVQMMTAPFVHKQYRNTKDRPFESFFTTAKPTFIMVEWTLDHGAGYCLTGMMVRRSQVSEEQNSEPLEIINFISEYPSRCEHDIYNIPVLEKSGKGVTLKGFNACKQIFELYKKDHSKKFLYYDMNNYAQSRQYFDKLAEYKIHYKEWETIIRKVNLKESGLSELFSDCKNENELVEKWFLDAIQSKLNRDKDRIKEFQSIIQKYVIMYKDNKSKIERRDTILQFKEDMEEVKEKAGIYRESEEKVAELENRIACLMRELYRIEELAKERQKQLGEDCQACMEQMAYITYEKLSMEVHELQDNLKMRISNRDMILLEMDALESEIEEVAKAVHLYECAKQQMIVDEHRQEYTVLTQRIDVSRRDEQELEPERRKIGGFLHNYYLTELAGCKASIAEKEESIQNKKELIKKQQEREVSCQKKIEELLVEISAGKTRLTHFDEREDIFNRDYKEKFSRNILGEYESGFLEIKKQEYDKNHSETIRSCNSHIRQMDETQERKRNYERNKEDKQNEKQNMLYELRMLEEQGKDYENQLKERRNIMRYLEADESQIWQKDKLVEIAERKLQEIDRKRNTLEKEKLELEREWKKLTSGEVLELPGDFRELLEKLDLHPVYGMTWLEKNGYSVEKNTKLVRQQPFLPYSLIISSAELKKLEAFGKEIYTSFPIPIIPRESLEQVLTENESSVLNFSGISFYLWFNEKLLDEEALHVLIVEKETEINKRKEQIALRRTEYQEYTDKKSTLKNQVVTEEKFEANRKEQEEVRETIRIYEAQILQITEELKEIEETIEKLKETIFSEKQAIEWCEKRDSDFGKFREAYENYLEDRRQIEHGKQEKQRWENNKAQSIALQKGYEDELRSLELIRQDMSKQLEGLQEKLLRYESYEIPEQSGKKGLPEEKGESEKKNLLEEKREAEELEARYDAITTKLSAELQELERQQEKEGNNLQRAEQDLERLREKYHLEQFAWRDTIYNEKEQSHQEIILETKQKNLKQKELLKNEEDMQIAVLDSKVEDKKKSIKEQCQKEVPLEKKEIHTIDFEGVTNQLKYQLRELETEMKKVEGWIQSLNENLTAFAEYQDFTVVKEIVWEEELAKMDAKRLREFAGMIRRDYRNETEEKQRRKQKVEAHLNQLLRKEIYTEDYYKKPLEVMLSVTGQAGAILAQLDTTIQSYDSQMAKLAVDIAVVEKEKAKIEGLLEDYLKDVHSNMGKIDNNSTITIREKAIKMLRIQLPDWEENEGLYHQRMTDFMDELTNMGIEIYERNENATDYFSTKITTKNMYDTVVGIGNVQIKLYKIEEQREYPITWAEVARNSGGEGFLSAFVILSALLHYMRRDDTDIFAERNEGKVLVMDNPFAQTNAVHLLKPLMDVAKKTNTQLICLSGLGGDSIYGRFDNIYVLNLVTAGLRGGMQYLRGEHKRGSEEETMVSSRIEVMEQQTFLF